MELGGSVRLGLGLGQVFEAPLSTLGVLDLKIWKAYDLAFYLNLCLSMTEFGSGDHRHLRGENGNRKQKHSKIFLREKGMNKSES